MKLIFIEEILIRSLLIIEKTLIRSFLFIEEIFTRSLLFIEEILIRSLLFMGEKNAIKERTSLLEASIYEGNPCLKPKPEKIRPQKRGSCRLKLLYGIATFWPWLGRDPSGYENQKNSGLKKEAPVD